jgi:tRNA(Ile)-lysidine synthase
VDDRLLASVRRDIRHHGLWPPGARVVVGLSGGADSVALVHLLHALAAEGAVAIAAAAHLNHALRPEADADEAFCRGLCERLGVPFVTERAPVRELAREAGLSIEAAGRRERYRFLERVRLAQAATRIAVAHTAEDQAETVLLRLLRGAGTRGLRGVLRRRGHVVRPLLSCRRDALRAWLAEREIRWREDASNADLTVPRNRIRHELLPLLARSYQPAIVRVLARTADVADAEDALLEQFAAEGAARLVVAVPGGLEVRRAGLAALPLALARRVVRRALVAAGARHAPDLADVDLVLAIGAGGPRAADVSGLRVERFSGDAVLLIRDRVAAVAPLPVRTLPIPGVVELPELGPGCRLRAERPIIQGDPGMAGRQARLRGSLAGPLVVRSRRPGDRIRPVGLGGTKKVQDLLVDRKVPRADRDRVPVVTDAAGRLLWVAGHALDAEWAAPAVGDDVIVLTFEPPVTPGSEGS